jgi:hypothetical protein
VAGRDRGVDRVRFFPTPLLASHEFLAGAEIDESFDYWN